jgi:hypothetical protein
MSNTTDTKINLQRRAVVAGVVAAYTQLFFPVSAFAEAKRPVSTGGERMDIDRFVADCIAANAEADAQNAVNEVLARAVSTRSSPIFAVN